METFVTGYGRIGEKRELKFALEKYWKKEITLDELEKVSKELRERHFKYQLENGIDAISCNDFSWYDQTLDMIVTLGLEPKQYRDIENSTDRYFAMARGDKSHRAMEMTKWFNTNYHYIVPELSEDLEGKVNIQKIRDYFNEAKAAGVKNPKINIIGPLTFLANAKRSDSNKEAITLFSKILPLYEELLKELSTLDDRVVVQIEEPIFVTDKVKELQFLIKEAYDKLGNISDNLDIFVITYFDYATEAAKILAKTNIKGIGLDFIYDGGKNLEVLKELKENNKILVAGIVDGRNVWRSDIDEKVALLEEISKELPKENIIIAPSCSLLHIPFSLKYEEKMNEEVKSLLSFAYERLEEIRVINKLFRKKELSESEQKFLDSAREAQKRKKESKKVTNQEVQKRMATIDELKHKRTTPFKDRIKLQHEKLKYPPLATTTIGSFPQTSELRKVRRDYKNGVISKEEYENYIKDQIRECVKFQEEIDIDVLVHGEFERNDMVEYFGEQLDGVAFSQNGWVQSYGSRCVKPPLIYGDVSRPKPMTVDWITFAQSLTSRPMKGMLTGPVTILNWSFVRDDQPRSTTCYQIALAIRDEVDDLQKNGIGVIQVDEAAFKEGYPLRSEKRGDYEKYALESFWITTNVAKDETQIHTHMCYSEFNDIIDTIEAMDADVISIETARSGNVLLQVFKARGYEMEIGPGIYDIHSPRIPSKEELIEEIKKRLEVLPPRQLWVNPDCGLKTRNWAEVKPSLKNMVDAAKAVRKELNL
ncbi:MAG: 5-methyltetrahydropteroyltriglutamate--homocysteine S-methyltransferase [Epsilonproteobacteria bacterium]|nr:5-methyltetrahydropteroyltriglutamate--homocysteine S-methyltransferase [Campylobacterota bacterium]